MDIKTIYHVDFFSFSRNKYQVRISMFTLKLDFPCKVTSQFLLSLSACNMAPSICLVIRFISKIFSLILLAHTYGSDLKFQITKNLISLPESVLVAVVCVLRDVYDWPKFLNYDQSHNTSYTCD